MPQMDFSTFFPQVFWLITLIGFSFFYLLRGFFSYSIMILKLRGRYISSFFIFFITFFLKMFNEFVIFIRTTVFKFSGILFRNKFFYKSFNNLLNYFQNKNSYFILKRQNYITSSFSTSFLFFTYFFNNLD
jgi:hypothetical protein